MEEQERELIAKKSWLQMELYVVEAAEHSARQQNRELQATLGRLEACVNFVSSHLPAELPQSAHSVPVLEKLARILELSAPCPVGAGCMSFHL